MKLPPRLTGIFPPVHVHNPFPITFFSPSSQFQRNSNNKVTWRYSIVIIKEMMR